MIGRLVGEDADHVGAPLDLLVHPLERVGAPDLLPVGDREGGEGQHVLLAPRRASRRRPGSAASSLSTISSSCSRTAAASGWAKIVRIAARTISALPFGMRASTLRRKWTRQRCQAAPRSTARDGALEALVGVADDEPHAGQAARPERAQEGRPEGAVLAVADRQARAPPGRPSPVTPVATTIALRHDRRALVGLDVGGVEEHVGEADVVERALPEGRHDRVELAADPAHLALADARVDAQGGDQVVHLARATRRGRRPP